MQSGKRVVKWAFNGERVVQEALERTQVLENKANLILILVWTRVKHQKQWFHSNKEIPGIGLDAMLGEGRKCCRQILQGLEESNENYEWFKKFGGFSLLFPEGKKKCVRRWKLPSKAEKTYKKDIGNCSGSHRSKLANIVVTAYLGKKKTPQIKPKSFLIQSKFLWIKISKLICKYCSLEVD